MTRRTVCLAAAGVIMLCAAGSVARAAAADGAAPSLEASLMGVLDLLRERGEQVAQALTSLDGDWRRVQAAWSGVWSSADMLRAATYGLVLLMIGCGTEWLYWCYAGSARRAIAEAAMAGAPAVAPSAATVAALAGRRLLLEAFGLILFGVAVIGASSAFVWPGGVHEAIVGLTLGVTGARAAIIMARFVLSPRPARLRLIVLDDPAARRLYRLTVGLVVMLAAIPGAAAMVGLGGELRGLTVVGRAGAGMVLAALAVAMVQPRPALRRREHRVDGATIRQFAATALIAVALVLYLLDLRPMVWSIAVVLLAGVADRTLRAIADRFTPDPSADPVPSETVAGRATTAAAYRSVLHRALDISIFAAAVVALAAIWGAPVLELARSGTVAGRLLDVAIVLLVADLVWVWAKTAIDRRLASIAPPEGVDQTADPSARLATLLPLLRKGLLILVSTTTVLIALSALGIDIAPLLAGAGVVGIAIGFGAQTLVRDIVSGVFYLLEDSFRIGEYVEFGNIRGTVEGISLRFLRLRHHRGPVHTIPFGEVRWLTNHSRDWVMVKLDFRVPFDTDVELARKLIKKIGQDLMDDPELGSCIIEPVKSRGVVRLEEYCMVIGVKFMAKPGDGQFMVRREAYHRIRDAFAANGMRFHDRSVKVEVVGQPADAPSSTALGAAAGDIAGALGSPTKRIED